MTDTPAEPPLEPARRLLGAGVEGRVPEQKPRTIVRPLHSSDDTLRIHVRIAALQAAVAGGGISESPERTLSVAADYETWITREIVE